MYDKMALTRVRTSQGHIVTESVARWYADTALKTVECSCPALGFESPALRPVVNVDRWPSGLRLST